MSDNMSSFYSNPNKPQTITPLSVLELPLFQVAGHAATAVSLWTILTFFMVFWIIKHGPKAYKAIGLGMQLLGFGPRRMFFFFYFYFFFYYRRISNISAENIWRH